MCNHEEIFRGQYYWHCKECLDIIYPKSKTFSIQVLVAIGLFLMLLMSYTTFKPSGHINPSFSKDSVSEELIATELLILGLSYQNLPKAMKQCQIESNYGKSKLYDSTNNLFGMRPAYSRKTYRIGVYHGFAVFSDWKLSIKDYMERLKQFSSFDASLNNYTHEEGYKQTILQK